MTGEKQIVNYCVSCRIINFTVDAPVYPGTIPAVASAERSFKVKQFFNLLLKMRKPMSNKKNTFLLLFTITALLTMIFSPLHARDYRMDGLDLTINIDPDGAMHIREDWTFVFDGRFSQVFRTFPLNDLVTIDNIRVYEGDREYLFSDNEEPGTTRLVSKRDYQELQVFFNGANTTRVFSIRYRLKGAIARHEDAALLYYKLVSDEWEKPVHNITARIYPPESLPPGEPAHWLHGSIDAVSEIEDGGVVTVQLSRLPAMNYLEIRALYPPGVFPDLAVTEGMIREEVMQDAARLAEEANRIRQEAIDKKERQQTRFQTGRQIAWPLALVIIFVWGWLYQKYGRRPGELRKEEPSNMLPEKEPPALINYLMHFDFINVNALVSTIFDLSHRGYLKIEEREAKSGLSLLRKKSSNLSLILEKDYLEANRSELLPYEEKLLSFLFGEIAGHSGEMRFRDMEKKKHKVQKFMSKWNKSIKEEGKKKEWFDRESIKGRNIGLIAGICCLIVFIISTAIYGPWMLLPFVASLFLLIGSFFILHRTAKGKLAYEQWKALRKYLKKHQFEPHLGKVDGDTINGYLIYGIAMGLGPRFIKRFARSLELQGHTMYMGWIVLHTSSMSDFGNAINRVITTTSTTMSSASGMGGGGTAGGGGGVSSGGGGAR